MGLLAQSQRSEARAPALKTIVGVRSLLSWVALGPALIEQEPSLAITSIQLGYFVPFPSLKEALGFAQIGCFKPFMVPFN